MSRIPTIPANYTKLTPEQRRLVREEYVRLQKGCCAYCGGNLSKEPPEKIKSKDVNWLLFPPNFLKYPVHLHHRHDTGMTIGAVHALCNAVSWCYDGV
jgi:hypothetical protein